MKIGIEAQRILRKKKHGMDMVALQLIKALQHAAPEHEYVVFVRPGDDHEVLKELGQVKVEFVHGFTYADWEQLWLPLAIMRNNIDLMHFTSNTASVLCPVPYVLTLHDVIFMENRQLSKVWYQKLGALYRKWIVPVAVRQAFKVVTVSIFESGRIAHFFPGVEKKLRVIYNAASSIFSENKKANQNPKLKDLPSKFFLFLGNTDPKKNTQNVIKAYINYRNQLKGDLPLVIGDYPRALVEQTLIEEGEGYLMEDVISLGYLSQGELSGLYQKATAFLYPSLRESFGIPLVEAMASGCAVITSQTSCLPEIAEGAAVLINPNSPTEIATAMKKIEDDALYSRQLIDKGVKRARQFDWMNSAINYASLYKEILMPKILNKLSTQNL